MERERERQKDMELNRDPQMSPLHILHLSPPPSLSPLLFAFYLPVSTYSLHPFCGWIHCGLSPFSLLLTWVPAGGASHCLLLRRQSIWACGGKARVDEPSGRHTVTDLCFYNSQCSQDWNQ